MNCILFDDRQRDHLLPLTYTRPVSELRTGILTLREKWELRLGVTIRSWLTADYLSAKYPCNCSNEAWYLNGGVCASDQLASEVKGLKPGQGLRKGSKVVGVCALHPSDETIEWIETTAPVSEINALWDLFVCNHTELVSDFDLLTRGRESEPLSASNRIVGEGAIFLEPGARVELAMINATNGPVYIGRNAEVMEGVMIRGPFSLGEGAVVNMGTKIYGATTVGPYCKVGGELNNVVMLGYSNKGHDGFLGNSVIGEWCNLGADTNTSNLKNTYEEVKLWNYATGRFVKTGLQFCGLIMGDHSKCGINTMFNTGTVVGIGCNIYGTGFPRNFVPSFLEGGTHGYRENPIRSVLQTAERVMARRNVELTETDREILDQIYQLTAENRDH